MFQGDICKKCIQFIFFLQNFYLVGSNNTETRFRVLKIDRSEQRELCIHDDKVEYNQSEIHDLVNRIDSGNRHRSGSTSFAKVTSAFGIVGKFIY